MPDSEHIITLGIGSAPGSVGPFVRFGLDANPPRELSMRDRPGSHTQEFAVGDILQIKGYDGSSVIENWLVVGAVTDQTTYHDYTTYKHSGTATMWPAGTTVINWGAAGEGIVRSVTEGTYPYYIEALTHAGQPWNAVTRHAVFGNLRGFTATAEWGVALGADLDAFSDDYAVLSDSRFLFNRNVSLAVDKLLKFVTLPSTTQWVLGVDSSDSDRLKIHRGTTMATPGTFELDTGGNMEIAAHVTLRAGDVHLSGGYGLVFAQNDATRLVCSNGTRHISQIATGDVSLSSAAFTVTAIRGYAVQNHAPENGEGLVWSAANNRYEPGAVGSGTGMPTPSGEGYILRSNSDPAFVEYQANGNAQILIGNGTTIQSRGVSGDITLDNAGATEVAAIRGYDVQDHAPLDGEALVWSTANSRYEPTAVGAGSGLPTPSGQGMILLSNAVPQFVEFDASGDGQILVGYGTSAWMVTPAGDVTMTNAGGFTVVGIRGYDIQDHAPLDGEVLVWNATNVRYEPGSIGGGGISLGATAGAIIYANGTPEWSVMSHPGSAYQHLETTSTLLQWTPNLTLADAAWIGLGVLAGRIAFDDEVTDLVTVHDAEFVVGAVDDNSAAKFWVNGILHTWVEGGIGTSHNTFSYGADSGTYSRVAMRRARGTQAAPSATQSGDIFGRVGGGGYGATSFPTQSTGFMQVEATQNWTDAAWGTELHFYVTPNSFTTPVVALTLEESRCAVLDQGAEDGFIVRARSSDVAHQMTTIVETQTWYGLQKVAGGDGGAKQIGLSDATVALQLCGYANTASSTHSSAGRAAVEIIGAKRSGSTIGALASGENLLAIRDGDGAAEAIITGNGDIYLAGKWQSFDAFEDDKLLSALQIGLRTQALSEDEQERWNILRRKRVVSASGMINVPELQKLLVGAVGQHGQEIQSFASTRRRVTELEAMIMEQRHQIGDLRNQVNALVGSG